MTVNSSIEKISSDQSKFLFVGTANLNKEYGVGKRSSAFDKNDLAKLFFEVETNRNVFLDTAQSYDGVENIIGEIGGKKLDNKIITKISPTEFDTTKSIINLVKKSLTNLNQNSLFGILLHDASILHSPNINDLIQGLELCIQSGIVNNIGISGYESTQILSAAKKFSQLTTFQINENIIDQRNFNNEDFDALSNSNKNLFVRSVFLQGNLLVSDSEIIESLTPERKIFTSFKDFCERNNSSPIKVCLDYAKSITWSNGIIVGVNSFDNYLEIMENFSTPIKISNFSIKTLRSFYSVPRNWIDS